MPRLLVLTSTFPRWRGDVVTRFVVDLCGDLQERGWDVTVLAPHAPGAATSEQLDGLAVHRFRYAVPARAEVLAYGGGALPALRRSPAAAALLPLFLAAELTATARLLQSGRFDAVHSHWVLPQGAAASTTAPRAGVPHLATAHGSDVLGLGGGLLRRAKRAALLRADAVSVNSGATAAAVRDLVPDHPAVHRIPMGVALGATPAAADVARSRERWTAGGEGPVVGFVGRLVGWKGVADLLAAVAIARAAVPGLRAVVAGDGPEAAALALQARELGIAEAVSFPGWLDGGEVAALLAAVDVLAFPSRREADGTTEGQGLALLEAMASGTPVVATAVGGIPDSLTDGEHGLLVPQRDPAALATALLALLTDRPRAERLAAAGARRVETHFGRPASADAFDALLRSLLPSKAR